MTVKPNPRDVDAVIRLPADFSTQVAAGILAAIEIEQMILTRRPEELFAAEDEPDWNDWIAFFSKTREPDGRQKGLIEVIL